MQVLDSLGKFLKCVFLRFNILSFIVLVVNLISMSATETFRTKILCSAHLMFSFLFQRGISIGTLHGYLVIVLLQQSC